MIRTNDLVRKALLSALMATTFLLAACSPSSEPGPDATAKPAEAAPAITSEAATHAVGGPEAPLPLPTFTPCASKEHPKLPEKWESSAVMQGFYKKTVWYGKFVYDESAGAFRFSLADRYGIDADLLVTTEKKLYLLEGGGDLPKSCTLLTTQSPYSVPTRDWLDSKAVCVGQAPILERDRQWWKNPAGKVGANWFWYDNGTGAPFRSMYYTDKGEGPTNPVPIYEYFTFNYFPGFKKVDSTNLAQILAMCPKQKSAAVATREYGRFSVEPLAKKSSFPQTNDAAIAKITSWIPGISECSSTGALPPPWPDRVQATAFMTAVNFNYNPFPTRIYYDWPAKSQNTTLYYYPPTATNYAQTAYLLGDTGYITNVEQGGTVSQCLQVLPGPPVPDWNKVDGCECRAQIAPHTELNPSDVPTKILWCPTDLQLQQVFWTWYSDAGRPVVFMQSNSSPSAGTGLNLADYSQWGPGSVAPKGTYDLPQACQGVKPPPSPPPAFPQACNNCHLPLNEKKAAMKTP